MQEPAKRHLFLWLLLLPLFQPLAVPVATPISIDPKPNAFVAQGPIIASQSAAVEAVKATPTPTPTPTIQSTPKPPARTVTAPSARLPAGSHEDWMRAAGIAQADWGYVEYIIAHESGWNPNAVNKSSGACGLGQQLPCGKWAHTWNDPIGALIDASVYARARYGSWAGAYAAWKRQGWW